MAFDANEQPIKILIENVYKIFGRDPKGALEKVRGGIGKTELLEQTGHVVGISDVSIDVRQGETYVVMGLSGSGKSTLIRHINRLIEPTSGRILVDGDDILQLSEAALREFRRKKVSMVFQRFALLPHKTVLENTMYGLLITGADKNTAREKAAEQIEIVGLSGFENSYPRQLSGGMQQRVGLARALATDAEILLMDEAFSALDPLIRSDMQLQLKELQEKLHKTIVFITHDLDEALRIGDRIAILKDGELRQAGTGEEILLNPADDYVERFVRDVNRARVVTIGSIAQQVVTLDPKQVTPQSVADHTEDDQPFVFVSDGEGGVAGAVFADQYEDGQVQGDDSHDMTPVETVTADTVIEDALSDIATCEGPIAVLDESGEVVGTVTRENVLEALARPPEAGDDAQSEPEDRPTSPRAPDQPEPAAASNG
ncbi:MAG: glycine betaine/L-proline ABC transporter ATP-binding protein [Pseudomonadota bacterium]